MPHKKNSLPQFTKGAEQEEMTANQSSRLDKNQIGSSILELDLDQEDKKSPEERKKKTENGEVADSLAGNA